MNLYEAIFGESASGRLFGKGGDKPGWKTIQRFRGAAANERRQSHDHTSGANVSKLSGEWARARALGRLVSKWRRARDQRDTDERASES